MGTVGEIDLGHRLEECGAKTGEEIPVHISYEIIRLFSEGLYQSPQKAVEELVSNGYDAEAGNVYVLLPEADDEGGLAPLWVVDDGNGMTSHGFEQLWRVADSKKAEQDPSTCSRPPIGQFGIGKLAAYVLAWRLTHISKVNGKIHCTSLNFRQLEEVHQYESSEPFQLGLYELTQEQAKDLLSDIEARSPEAWERLFGETEAADSWTVAGLSDFKDLYNRLSAGRLRWVLSTGLPLHSSFSIWLNSEQLKSSKETYKGITSFVVGENDEEAKVLGLEEGDRSILIPGIEGPIAGEAHIYERRLTEGKSDQYGRSHGFFIRVRGRVINLEDELFGLDALNHAAWSRFSMEIEADGLRDHLLSSREGVRDSEAITTLRKYLHRVFNRCRRAFDEREEREVEGLDIQQLLREAPSLFITDPMLESVRDNLRRKAESFYFARPEIPDDNTQEGWLSSFSGEIRKHPFKKVLYEKIGPYERALQFLPDTQTLVINSEHPFIDKLIERSGSRAPATLFGSSEILMDSLLLEHGLSASAVVDFLEDRDRILRLIAGEDPSTALEMLRLLAVANNDDVALERATGLAFRILGFRYERRGGNKGGTDGVLFATLGLGDETRSDYKLVYDAKQTNQPAVPADKIDLASLEDFRIRENADYGFFVATKYQAADTEDSKINRKIAAARSGPNPQPVTLIRIHDLERLIGLHYKYGITLTTLRGLFEEAHTSAEVDAWIADLEVQLAGAVQVPLKLLLEGLEEMKSDEKSRPNINAVRVLKKPLMAFEPEKLQAALCAVETIIGNRWIEVDRPSGDVLLHSSAGRVAKQVERHLGKILGGGDQDDLEAETES